MANINEILARAAALRNETALNSIDPERAGGIMYDTLVALNELWLQQGAALVISKIYASVAAMNADTSPVSDLTGKPIRSGMIVVIASSDSDNGSVYRYNGPDSPSWSLVGKIGNLEPVDSLDSDSTQLPLAARQGKVLDEKISQLGQKFGEDIAVPLTIEQGTIDSATGQDSSSTLRLRNNGFIDADKLHIIATNGDVYIYGYQQDGTYIGAGGSWQTGDIMAEIAGAQKYRLSFKRTNGASLTPADFYTLGISVMLPNNGVVVQLVPQSLTEEEKTTARTNIGAASAEDVNVMGQEADTFFPQLSLRITPDICSNSGYIKSNGDIAQQANYGHSDPIAVQKGQSIVISGVGTAIPYFAYCTQDGTFIRASVVSTGISSVYKITFSADGYVQLNGRVVPTQDGEVASGFIYDGLTLEDAEYLFKVNVFKYVSSRGTAFTPSANNVKVTLGEVFLYDVISGSLLSITDSTERTLDALNRYLVYNGGNIYVRGASSSFIEKGDVVLLYFDATTLDIECGVLYPSYIKYNLTNSIEKTHIKFVATRGTVYNLLASSLEVTLGTLFVYKGSSVLSIPDSTKYTLSERGRYLVVTNSNTIAIRPSGAQIQQDDIVLLYYDDNSANKDAVGGLLYPDYIKWKQSAFVSEVFNDNVKKYVSTRGALYIKNTDNVKVTLNTLFVYDVDKDSATTISDNTEYTLRDSARYLVLQANNTIATRAASLQVLSTDFILLYYDDNQASLDIKGGALYADYIKSQIGNVEENNKVLPSNLGQINCIRKAYQMATFKWTPKIANMIPYNNGTFPASQQEGMIYSSVKEYSQFVFEDVSLETFMTAVNNQRSVLYTENVSAANSRSAIGRIYKGTNCAAYYGSVCSGLLIFAYGLPRNVTTFEFRYWDKMEVIKDQTPYGLEIGDAVWQTGHIQLVTGITKDKYGFITDIEIVENAAATTKIKHYSVNALQNYITTYDCVLLRYKELYANRSYTPLTDFVAVMDETKGTYNYNNDLCPNYGDKSNYNEGDEVVLNLRTDYASAGFTTLEVYKGDTLLISRAISGQDEILSGLEYGDYKARIIGSSNSEYCHFKVVNSVVTRSNDSFTFSSANATPLYYEFCDIAGERDHDAGQNGLTTKQFTSEEISAGQATPSGNVVPSASFPYLKVHFATDYGRVIKIINWYD